MDAHIYAEMAALEDNHWWFVARRKILDKLIATLPLPANAQILEAGCGTGGNLAMLAKYGQVYAMEANVQALELAATLRTTSAMFCSHGDVIPDVLDALLAKGMKLKDELRWQKASTWVLTWDGSRLTKGRYLPPPC